MISVIIRQSKVSKLTAEIGPRFTELKHYFWRADLPEDLIQAFIDFDHLLARQFGLGLAEVAVRGGLYKITRTTELMGPTGSITVSSEPR